MASSSSMTCTVPSVDIGQFLLCHRAQRKPEDRAAARVWLRPDAAAVRFDDGPANREADTHTFALAGHEWLKQLLRDVRRNAAAGVGYADCEHAVLVCG